MTIQFEYEAEQELGFDCASLAKEVAQRVLEMEKCPFEAQVNLIVATNEEIKRINTEFRGIAAPTDVLSFPNCEFETPGDFSGLNEDVSNIDLDTQELVLGDIMISVERVFSQAEEYGHSTRREFAFLVAHSMLHLTGYDHMEPDEAREMERFQEEVLQSLGIGR